MIDLHNLLLEDCKYEISPPPKGFQGRHDLLSLAEQAADKWGDRSQIEYIYAFGWYDVTEDMHMGLYGFEANEAHISPVLVSMPANQMPVTMVATDTVKQSVEHD